MAEAYPDYEWLPWKFAKIESKYWDDIANQRKFMDYLAKQLNMKDKSDWYNITQKVEYIFKEKNLNKFSLIFVFHEKKCFQGRKN